MAARVVLLALFFVMTTTHAATKTLVLAGGCFWCMEKPYDAIDGVLSTTSGYAGGRAVDATYAKVSAGQTEHLEVLHIVYDPAKVGIETLLDVFWRNIDPLDARGQFCDKGAQYRSAMFYGNDVERAIMEASKVAIETKLGQKVATDIRPSAPFYAAEDYHQNYYQRNPVRYKLYRYGCGRDARLAELWSREAGGANLGAQ